MKITILTFLIFVQSIYADPFTDFSAKKPVTKNFGTDWGSYSVKDGPIQKLGIRTTGCLGNCPVYEFIVSKDGTFTYEGDAYSKRKGRFIGTCYSDLAFEYAASLNLSLYADEYISDATDLAGVFILIQTKNGGKVIFNYCDLAPMKIRVLEELIRSLMMDATWKKIR